MKLIENWRHAWRLWSVRLSALGALLTTFAAAAPDTLLQIWNGLPDDVRAVFPETFVRVIPTLLFVATIVARLIPQKAAADRRSLWKSITGKVAPKAAGGIAAAALAMIAGVIAIEGGYVNHPADPGGEILGAGDPLDPTMLTEVVMQQADGTLRRVCECRLRQRRARR